LKLNRLSAFTLGVVITAVSVGAVTFANAAGDATLKACANKSTGVMRYIAKGSCKKTETSLSWSQMGPQGLTGTAGPKGDAGSTGATGQNFSVVDADGKTLGKFVSIDSIGGYVILADNRLWSASPTRFGFWGFPGAISFYSDASCQSRLIENELYDNDRYNLSVSHQWVGIEHNTNSFPNGALQKAFVQLDNTKWPKTSFSGIYTGGFGSGCNLVSSDRNSESYIPDTFSFYKTVEIPMLTYTAPLTIVAG